MDRRPRISIVTPVLDRETGVAETVQSVAGQDYPNLEHIVSGGGAGDRSLQCLGRPLHLTVVAGSGRSWVEAVNEGFAVATGDIRGCLHPGDTLAPGALHRVSLELDPARSSHVVIGGCRFLDQQGRIVGLEHPGRPEGNRRLLEVWRSRRIVPPPAFFWTRRAWETCGPFDGTVKFPWADYDLLGRLSREYPLHWVDQVFVNCPLRPGSRTEQLADSERIEDGIEVSRRYWGSPTTPTYWRLWLSLMAFRLDRLGRARRDLGRIRERWRRGQIPQALGGALAASILAPEVVFYVSIYPRIRARAAAAWTRSLERLK